MNPETLKKAVSLGEKIGHVLVVTADGKGLPHAAAAGSICLEGENRTGVSSWFCPGTLANLEANPHIGIVVWDSRKDEGYQLLGRCEGIEDMAMMNGFPVEAELRRPLPQIERKLHVRVEKILCFTHAPHSDVEDF